jgi:carboxypeptidase family protein/alpha amylase-like protein
LLFQENLKPSKGEFPMKKTRPVLLAIMLWVPLANLALAQFALRSTISGTVTDPSKAVMPNVQVVLKDLGRNQTFTTMTNESGLYSFANLTPGSEPKRSPSGKANGRDQVPQRWWESAPAIMRVHLKAREDRPAVSLDPAKASAQLDEIREAGFTVIEIFAPAEGGNSFGGLDTINRYRIDPALGTMDDFQRLVRLAHSKGMAVITFDNLGYCSVEASDFLKACDDVKAGRDSKEARFFL